MIYAFDLDSTLCSRTDGDYHNAKPWHRRIAEVNQLFEQGHKIVIFTARGMDRFHNIQFLSYIRFYWLTRKQLKNWGVKYHTLQLGKVMFDILIDDKAINSEVYFAKKD